MKNPAPALIKSYIAFGIVLAITAAVIIISAVSAQQGIQETALKAPVTPAPVKVDTQPKTKPAAQDAAQNKASEPSSRTSSPATVKNEAAAPQSAIGGEAPRKQQGAHVPFTTKPVTPGDPESYVDTVGQCPFYEMGGPKGCVPPPDLECNADWSECHVKES